VNDNGTVTNGSDGLSLTTHSVVSGQFLFTFEIGAGGVITGKGTGDYTEATYSPDGSYEKGPISCVVPLTGSPFTVEVSGQATYGKLTGLLENMQLHITAEGAEETNENTDCGSEFTIYATNSTILADSLAAAGQPLIFSNSALSDTTHSSSSYDNGNGTVGTDQGTWGFEISPSLSFKQAHKEAFQNLADAFSYLSGATTAALVACGALALSPPPVDAAAIPCGILFGAGAAGDAIASTFFGQMARDPVETDYRSISKPRTGHTPRIRPVHGINATQATALNSLLKAQAQMVGLASAVATAVNRYSGAALAKNTEWEHKQRAAARLYAGQLASSLATELATAKHAQSALADTVFRSVKIDTAEIRAVKESITAHGIPQSLATELADLKVPSDDLAAIRTALERANPAIIATPFTLLTALDIPDMERDARTAIQALRSIARKGT